MRMLFTPFRLSRLLSLLPLTCALLTFPSLQFQVALDADGVQTRYFGFPLPWNADSLATSMGKTFYALPLAIDLLVLGALAWWILAAIDKLPRMARVAGLAAVWCCGLPCAAFLGFAVALDPFFMPWPDLGALRVISVKVGLGV